MIYLDNAATSYPKPDKVYDEMLRCMKEYCANPGRGGHSMSIMSGREVFKTRELIAGLFNIKNSMAVSFTKNATEALNIAIKGFLKRGDHVITTCMEHNSVIRPLRTLERDLGIEITFIKGDELGEVYAGDFAKSIRSNTKLIVSTFSSNVNGIVMPVKDIGSIAKDNGIPFLLDASQGAGSTEIDVEDMNIDMLAFPGHKGLMGPQGTGGLYVRDGLNINPIMQGGTGSSSESMYQPDIMPDVLESGTLNTPGIVGLGVGIEFINSFGLQNLKYHKQMLVERLYEGIKELAGVKLYSKKEIDKNTGIVAMNFEDTDSSEVSYCLDKVYNIATRAGLHCAPIAHETLNTLKSGIVRFSVGCFNTIDDIDLTVSALREISQRLFHI
jgi:cysteine desulfurase family protein